MTYRGIVLPPEAAEWVAGGGCDLPFERLRSTEGLEAGRPLRALDPAGRLLGLALADAENERLRVLSRGDEPFEALDEAFFDARVERALALRRGLGLLGPEKACRLLHGAGDGVPGFAADILGPWAVLYVYGRALVPFGRTLAGAVLARASLRGVVLKVRSRGAAGQGRVGQEVLGEAPPPKLVVEERGVPFEVHLGSGLNVGLFTDMREHRHALLRLAPGRAVLNGFSYTGTLSVVAARGGAASVTSVDLSSGVQNWARDNFRLSDLDPARHAFPVEDVGRFLTRVGGEGRRFGLVLLDPPSFSAARGAPFAIERDYPVLVARAAAMLEPGGLLWLASNTRAVSLVEMAREGLRRARREAQVLETGGLGPDHPTVLAQPEDRYLQVALFRPE